MFGVDVEQEWPSAPDKVHDLLWGPFVMLRLLHSSLPPESHLHPISPRSDRVPVIRAVLQHITIVLPLPIATTLWLVEIRDDVSVATADHLLGFCHTLFV